MAFFNDESSRVKKNPDIELSSQSCFISWNDSLQAEVVDQTAQQGPQHAAREGHQGAQGQQIAQQGGGEGHPDAVSRPQQDGAQDVDHVLDRGALAAQHHEGKRAAHHGHGAQQAGHRQLFYIQTVLCHDNLLLLKTEETADDSGASPT